jgi:hypothetical protein
MPQTVEINGFGAKTQTKNAPNHSKQALWGTTNKKNRFI